MEFIFDRCREKNAPTIVFINGLFAELTSFDPAITLLKERYPDRFHLLRYNGYGQGELGQFKVEELAEPLTLLHFVRQLYQLLGEVKTTGPIYLLGLSNGGRVALKFAELYQRDFLIPAVFALDTYDQVTPMIEAKLKSWLQAYLVGGASLRFDIATPWIWGEKIFNEKSEIILSYREKANLFKKASVEHLINQAIDKNLEQQINLDNINTPVHLICGQYDLLTPVFLHEKMLQRLKKGSLQIVETGHASIIERPNIILENVMSKIIENEKEGTTC